MAVTDPAPELGKLRTGREKISVLCVDDNEHLAGALRIAFDRDGGFEWKGWISRADDLVATVRKTGSIVIVLDVDMPGLDPFEAIRALAAECPECRTVVFSGHVRHDLIDRALQSGAWGYIAKTDGERALLHAAVAVHSDEIAMSPEVRACFERDVP